MSVSGKEKTVSLGGRRRAAYFKAHDLSEQIGGAVVVEVRALDVVHTPEDHHDKQTFCQETIFVAAGSQKINLQILMGEMEGLPVYPIQVRRALPPNEAPNEPSHEAFVVGDCILLGSQSAGELISRHRHKTPPVQGFLISEKDSKILG